MIKFEGFDWDAGLKRTFRTVVGIYLLAWAFSMVDRPRERALENCMAKLEVKK